MRQKNSIFISLKWKLSLALVCLSMGLVGLYVFVAKQVFESDKIAYVFESQQDQLESLSKIIEQRIGRILFDSRAILFSYDFKSKSLSPLAQGYFSSQHTILGIQAIDTETNQVVAILEKDSQIGQALNSQSTITPSDSVNLEVLSPTRFLISARPNKGSQDHLLLHVLADIPNLLPSASGLKTVLLAKEDTILAGSRGANTFQDLLSDLSRDRSAGLTGIRRVHGENYLVSVTPLSISDLKILLVEPESVALSAMGILYQRSLVFIAFSMFMTVILALGLSLGLTRKLDTLTSSASHIGQGKFSTPPRMNSNDEVGVLGRAFARMSEEIQKLLAETKEKTRMEEELKTASLVQESLFPNPSTFETNGFGVTGLYSTSTECGGDWWHYFENQKTLYVMIGDATGHGTPAALVTAAARSIFSRLERQNHPSLLEMAKDWDLAVASCSGKER
ncbi:MAG: HAMP domain-containing protein, partial [Bdellovibrionales bacterium]|nr:HAMP domain-containing protein [Bdellovibrionales bacterium]